MEFLAVHGPKVVWKQSQPSTVSTIFTGNSFRIPDGHEFCIMCH